MDSLIREVIAVAKLNNKKDPDRKAKELFIRLFKNDDFRTRYEAWVKKDLVDIKKNTFPTESAFLSWANARGYMEMPEQLKGRIANYYDFLGSAIYQFGLFGKISQWPIFGCRLEKIPIMEDYSEAAIIVHPEASRDDVLKFVEANWVNIKEVGSGNIFEENKFGKIVPRPSHLLNATIYEIKQEHPKFKDTDILKELKSRNIKINSVDKLGYIRKALDRERTLRKEKKVPKLEGW